MNELITADHKSDVRSATADCLEEDQVAGLQFIAIDVVANPKLVAHLARQRRAVLREHILDEAAAIEP